MWLTTRQVANLLRTTPRTLRKYETPDGRWCMLYGLKFRVYKYGADPRALRRYNEYEIMRIVEKLKQEA